MSVVTLRALLTLTPMEEEWKQKMMSSLDELTAENRFLLETTCWETLAELYKLKLFEETNKVAKEVREGKRPYNVNDYTEIQARLYHDFAIKLEAASSQEGLEEVRQKLEQYVKKPQEMQAQVSAEKTAAA